MPAGEHELVFQRIDGWRRRLIDLSYRNRLIRYRPTKSSTLEITAPELEILLADPERAAPWRFYFPPEPETEETHEQESDTATLLDEIIVHAAQQVSRAPQADEIVAKNEIDPRRINRILENLARKSNAEFQDKALRILYIAAGFLDWVDPTRDEALTSPLILVPVELRRESAGQPHRLHFVDDEDIVVNPSLTEKLHRDVNLDIPGEWTWEAKPIHVELDEIEEAVREKGWTVRRESVLGLFSFQKFVMYRDLLDNEELIARHPIVQSLAAKSLSEGFAGEQPELPELDELDDVQRPEDDLCVLDADSSQRLCIEAAKRGQSFVMQGPPGTGKSQTIANIISEFIGQGKRVLFVSEKAAALDVVHKRLAARGLDEFCLLLHGEHASRREVVQSIHRSLTGSLVPRAGMASHELERLGQLRDVLNSTAQLVHLPMPKLGDRSLWDIFGELAQLHAAPSVPAAPEATMAQGAEVRTEFQKLDEIFQRLAERWSVSPKGFVWRDYEAERFTADDRGRVLSIVQRMREATSRLGDSASDVARLLGWAVPINLRGAGHLIDLGEHVESAPRLAEHWLAPGQSAEIREAAVSARATFESAADRRRGLAAVYPTRTSTDFDSDQVAELDERMKKLAKEAGRTGAWENDLLRSLPKLRAFLREGARWIDDIDTASGEAAQLFGQPKELWTLKRASELSELVTIAFQEEHRPERDWLVRAGVDRARKVLDDMREKIERFQSERTRLLQTYEATILEVDVTDVGHRFADEYSSTLSQFRPSYRRDAKLVKSLRRDGKLPKDVLVQDLKDVSELQALGAAMGSQEARLQKAWDSYYRGLDTDVAVLDRALSVAERVLTLAGAKSDLAALGEQLSVGSSSSAEVAQLSDRLTTAMDRLNAGLRLIQPFASRVKHLDEAPLSELRAYVEDLRGALEGVAEVVDELEREASSPLSELSELERRARLVTELLGLESTVEEDDPRWRRALDYLYRGEETDWRGVEMLSEWLARFEELVGPALPTALRTKLLEEKARWPDFAGLETARRTYREANNALAALFEFERHEEITQFAELRELPEVLRLCDGFENHVDDLYDWADFRAWRARSRDEAWGEFLAALVEGAVERDLVVAAFRRAFWSRRLEALFEEHAQLADRGTTYARWIDEFRTLDRKLVRTAADRVIRARNALRTAHVNVRGSQVSLVLDEAAKKRRHRPVRVLLSSIPALLSEVKPCLMMSPLTVSHFLSPDHGFDVVLFDEASQVPPQDAINCIYRGKQVIVAGDSRQLPPTPFFQVAEADEEWDETAEDTSEDMESILDSCEALLPRHPLRWHYRSHHEQLIAFSNSFVYEGGLLTFPSADAFSETKGVRFIHVPDGVYDRGRTGVNRREAQVVAERVISHLLAGRHSVGVIAFNTHQATAIDEELERLRIEHPEVEEHFSGDRLDAVFVKHLESVQGDERDVIVFSVGYGPDADGRFMMNFGPLNKDGGYRRLNVAVTRGRDLVEVVSSVRAADFSLSDSAGRGPRLLRDYIRYAETSGASLGVAGEATRDDAPSKLEEAIGDAVRAFDCDPSFRVGTGPFRVDIGVRAMPAATSYTLGIETDGPAYAATPTARDRDRLRKEVLEGLKWRIHQIWSLDWVRNRQSEVDRLAEALERAPGATLIEEDSAVDPPHERTEVLVAELTEAIDSVQLPWVAEYERTSLPRQEGFYQFHETVNRQKQRDLLIELLATEAPIHTDYAILRLARAWGLKRTGRQIRQAGLQAIRMAVRNGAAELRGDFIWLPEQEITAVRSPRWDDVRTFRAIHEIPPEEIDLAFEKLLEASGGAAGEYLIAKVAKVLGFDRVGGNIRNVLAARLDALTTGASGGS